RNRVEQVAVVAREVAEELVPVGLARTPLDEVAREKEEVGFLLRDDLIVEPHRHIFGEHVIERVGTVAGAAAKRGIPRRTRLWPLLGTGGKRHRLLPLA